MRYKIGDIVKFKGDLRIIPSYNCDDNIEHLVVHGSTTINNDKYRTEFAKVRHIYEEYYLVAFPTDRSYDNTGYTCLGFKEDVLELVKPKTPRTIEGLNKEYLEQLST